MPTSLAQQQHRHTPTKYNNKQNTKLFARYGAINCHNRKELIMWLEKVVKESGGADGPGGRDGVHIATTEADPEGLYFVANT